MAHLDGDDGHTHSFRSICTNSFTNAIHEVIILYRGVRTTHNKKSGQESAGVEHTHRRSPGVNTTDSDGQLTQDRPNTMVFRHSLKENRLGDKHTSDVRRLPKTGRRESHLQKDCTQNVEKPVKKQMTNALGIRVSATV